MDNGTPNTPLAPPAAAQAGPGLNALQRRRLLLRGVGKGAAVVAAAVPMQSFANSILKTQGPPERLCTVSGVGSILPSAAPQIDGVCSGKTASYWQNLDQASWPIPKTTKFKRVFGGSNTITFQTLMAGSTSTEQTFARAYLNAKVGSVTSPPTFPYSPGEVVKFYQGTNRATAEAFFNTYV